MALVLSALLGDTGCVCEDEEVDEACFVEKYPRSNWKVHHENGKINLIQFQIHMPPAGRTKGSDNFFRNGILVSPSPHESHSRNIEL